ncbi:hypothetical protein A7J05_06905 [Streptomyces alfalfae]|uniref:Uncharacterized protein n=1 Tax=Streptomyces alfalfae TaxID=1642299 RepID=A0ABN4VGB6_9ACTN|nr:hypothetical protein A7J05_06905 [Streptomyces alfalfae]AYA15835.1 hypothetical protein D3X13_05955 [Streptomyces fradiae]
MAAAGLGEEVGQSASVCAATPMFSWVFSIPRARCTAGSDWTTLWVPTATLCQPPRGANRTRPSESVAGWS